MGGRLGWERDWRHDNIRVLEQRMERGWWELRAGGEAREPMPVCAVADGRGGRQDRCAAGRRRAATCISNRSASVTSRLSGDSPAHSAAAAAASSAPAPASSPSGWVGRRRAAQQQPHASSQAETRAASALPNGRAVRRKAERFEQL